MSTLSLVAYRQQEIFQPRMPAPKQSANPFGGGAKQQKKASKSRPFLDSVHPVEDMEEDVASKPRPPRAEAVAEPEPEAEAEPAKEALDISDINFDERMQTDEEETEEAKPDPQTSSWASSSWMSASPAASAVTITDTLPLVSSDDKSVFRFFWFDAYEDMRVHPG